MDVFAADGEEAGVARRLECIEHNQCLQRKPFLIYLAMVKAFTC